MLYLQVVVNISFFTFIFCSIAKVDSLIVSNFP